MKSEITFIYRMSKVISGNKVFKNPLTFAGTDNEIINM